MELSPLSWEVSASMSALPPSLLKGVSEDCHHLSSHVSTSSQNFCLIFRSVFSALLVTLTQLFLQTQMKDQITMVPTECISYIIPILINDMAVSYLLFNQKDSPSISFILHFISHQFYCSTFPVAFESFLFRKIQGFITSG